MSLPADYIVWAVSSEADFLKGKYVLANWDVEKGREKEVIERLAQSGIQCTVVGELLDGEAGIQIVENDQPKTMPYMETDPYWAAFFTAIKKGWK